MANEVIGDFKGAADIFRVLAEQDRARNRVPVLDEEGRFTGEFYDQRSGGPPDQPDPRRIKAHMQFLQARSPGRQVLTPGQEIPDFQVADPFESQTFGESIQNTLFRAFQGSITGDVERGISAIGRELGVTDTNDIADLFGLLDAKKFEGFQPNFAEQIGSEILSFFMPLDLATLAVGGAGIKLTRAGMRLGGLGYRLAPSVSRTVLAAGGGLKARGAAKIAKAATLTGSSLGTYEGATQFFRDIPGWEVQPGEIAKGFGRGAAFGSVLSMAGGILPSTILEAVEGTVAHRALSSAIGKPALKGGIEIATFGTMSGALEGRVPNAEDFAHAAGFIAGMRIVGLPGKITEARFNRLKAAETRRLKELGDLETGSKERVRVNMPKAGFNLKPIEEVEQGKRNSFKANDIIVGEDARKRYRKVLNLEFEVTDNIPEGAEGKPGWFSPEADKAFINRKMVGREGNEVPITIVHELYHAIQKRTGVRQFEPRITEETKAGKLEARTVEALVKRVERGQEKKPELTAKEKFEKGVGKNAFTKKLDKGTVTAKVNDKGKVEGIAGDAQTTAQGLVAEGSKTAKVSSIKIISEKSVRGGDAALGKARAGIWLREQKPKTGKQTSLEIARLGATTNAIRQSLVDKALKLADRQKKTLNVSPQMMQTAFFRGLQKQGIVQKVGKRFQVKAPATPETGQISFRTPVAIEAKTEARKHGVEFRGMQPAAEGKQLFNWHDPVNQADFYTATVAEMPARLKAKRAEFDRFKPKNLSFRTTTADLAKTIHPQVERLLGFWDMVKIGALQQIGKRFKSEVGKSMTSAFERANTRHFVLRGKQTVRLAEQTDAIAKVHGWSALAPRGIDTFKTRRQKDKIAKDLTDWIEGKDINGDPVVVPANVQPMVTAIKGLLAESAELIKKHKPDFKPLPNFFPRMGKRGFLDSVRDDIVVILGETPSKKGAIPERLLKGKPDRGVLDAIRNKNVALEKMIAEILKENKDIRTAEQALRLLRAEVIKDKSNHDPNFLRERTQKLPASYFERDSRVVLGEYFDQVAKWVSEVEEWGPNYKRYTSQLQKLRETAPGEEQLMTTLGSRAFGWFDANDRLGSTAQKWADWYTAIQVATKIGMGGATILNVGQPLISIIPDLGVWNTVRGGLALFDPVHRRKIRESGVLDNADLQALMAVTGYRPAGIMGEFADRVTKVSGFQAINKGLLYLSASTMDKAIDGWVVKAKGTGLQANWARQKLKDFNLDPKGDISKEKRLGAMARFATDSQLQKNLLKEALVMSDQRFKTLFLFKRFGIRQANYMGEMLRRELIERGNPMPLIRLAIGGYLGGTGISWGLNTIKQFLSGEPQYRQDDSMLETLIENLATIGAFGVTGDVAGITSLEGLGDLPRTIRFAATPVLIQDPLTFLDNLGKFSDDWDRYGDFWLATQRNTYRLFDTFGTWPRAAAKGAFLTPGQKQRRVKFAKGRERTRVFNLMLAGDAAAASDRVVAWNNNHPNREEKFKATDFTFKEAIDWLERRAGSAAEAEARRGTREFRAVKRRETRKRLKELLKQRGTVTAVRQAAQQGER